MTTIPYMILTGTHTLSADLYVSKINFSGTMTLSSPGGYSMRTAGTAWSITDIIYGAAGTVTLIHDIHAQEQ